jgi:exosortase D (VPLPA-CTERM-specific)
VAEACSGLRYLFPIMSFSYVFATLYRGPGWHKAVLLLAAAPLAVMMNTVRIAMVGIFVDRYGIAHAEGLSHFLEGWVVFLSCIVLLFLLAWALLRLQRSPLPLGQAMDLDISGLGPQVARLRSVRPSGALIAATLMVAGAAAAWFAAPERSAAIPPREPLALFPRDLGDWRAASPQILEPRVRASLGADDYYWSTFSNVGSGAGAAAPVDMLVAWYADQTAGGIHSPEVCIPGGGWEIARIETVDVAAAVGSAAPFPVNRAVIQRGVTRQMVYFWFDQAGVRTASDYGAKAQLLWNAMTLGRSDGALVRLTTPIEAGESEADAEARLQDLMRPLLGVLPRFVPGSGGRSRGSAA